MKRTPIFSRDARTLRVCGRALALVLPIAGAAACASTATPTPQLKSAQSAYSTASSGPARAYAPDSLENARGSLSRAQQANHSHDTQQVSFAHLAQSRAELADARGHTAVAVQERDASRVQLAQLQTQQAQRAVAECQARQSGVTAMQANALDSVADRKETLRGGGTAYIVSSGMTFEKNEATLSPEAKSKLDKVADAVKSAPPATTVIVEGFTDPSGGAGINNPLSERRAAAVAEYLKGRGVTGMVRTRGLGSSQPVGDNATHEGRSENRRVQVIIIPK
jgi:outer membrane protein OmpA-like peptidoglycan-associated protein